MPLGVARTSLKKMYRVWDSLWAQQSQKDCQTQGIVGMIPGAGQGAGARRIIREAAAHPRSLPCGYEGLGGRTDMEESSGARSGNGQRSQGSGGLQKSPRLSEVFF